MARLIGSEFTRDLALRDGTPVRLRPIRPADRAELERAFAGLSDASRYLRFLSATTRLGAGALDYLTVVDGENHLALVAGPPDEREGWGGARFVRVGGGDTAEAAITVVDAMQGRGLGKLLLAALTVAARERGIARFTAEILASNARMLQLLRALGASTHAASASAGVLAVDLPLPELPRDLATLGTTPGAELLRWAARELRLLGAP